MEKRKRERDSSKYIYMQRKGCIYETILLSLFPLFLLSHGWLIALSSKQHVHTHFDIAIINKVAGVKTSWSTTACVAGDTYLFNFVLVDVFHLRVWLWN